MVGKSICVITCVSIILIVTGCGMAHVVSCQPLTMGAQVEFQARPCGIHGAQRRTWTGFSPSTSVFPCQYHSTIGPYSFIHLPYTLYNVFLPILLFSSVSIIPQNLHSHHLLSTTFIRNKSDEILQTTQCFFGYPEHWAENVLKFCHVVIAS
jgi:hypothetical protein